MNLQDIPYIREQLRELEEKLANPKTLKLVEERSCLIADDFIEFGSSKKANGKLFSIREET